MLVARNQVTRTTGHVLVILALAGCHRDDSPAASSGSARLQPDAAGSKHAQSNLEPLATELIANAACERLRGQFRALPDNGRVANSAGTVGTVWIRDCLYLASHATCPLTMLVRATSAKRPSTISWYTRPAEDVPAIDEAPLRCPQTLIDDRLLRRPG